MASRSPRCASPPATTKTPTASRCPAALPEPGRGMWGKTGMFPPPTMAATVFFRRMANRRRRDGVLDFEQRRDDQGVLRLPGQRVGFRASSSIRKDFRPGQDRANSPFPTFPGTSIPIRRDRGMWGKRGMLRPTMAGATVLFSPDADSRAAAMEGSAVSAAGSGVHLECDVGSCARSLGRNDIRSARTDQNIPRIPHFPRNARHADRGMWGKRGNFWPRLAQLRVIWVGVSSASEAQIR